MIVPACAAVAPVRSLKIGTALLMIKMPAVTLRNSISQSR